MEKNSKWEAQMRSRRKIYEQFALKTRRDICLNSRLENAANAKGISKNAYLLSAVEKQLSIDGYGLDTVHAQKNQDTDND